MDRPDYEHIRKLLLSTDDVEITSVVRVLDTVFRSEKWRPLASTLADERDLIATVQLYFPTPFARKFGGWIDAEADYQRALEGLDDIGLSISARDRAEQAASRRFRDAFLEMWACWLQIVHFMPFVLMAALRRLDDEVLKGSAAKELSLALHHYKTFYEKYNKERRLEADQLHLLIFLSRLYRRLRAHGKLGENFVFTPLLTDASGDVRDLVPERFDSAMLLIQQVRNRIIHDRVENHAAVLTRAIYQLVKWCFLDIIAALAPIARHFGLTYAQRLELAGPVADVAAFDFSGADGPREAYYRVDATPRPDEDAFVENRLYFITRRYQLGLGLEGSGTALLPRDYLDLTPFLIPEKLRTSELDSGERRRMVFALQQYLEPLERLLFSELGGTSKRTLQADPNDVEARLLLEQIDRFKLRARQLSAQITIKEGRHANIAMVRSQLWLIARGHLASLMNVQGLGTEGDATPSATSSLRQTYNELLYVEPPAGGHITDFLRSPKRALMLVGGSGFGKTNLLLHHFLERQRAGRLGVFLSARQFDLADFRADLMSKLIGQIASEWRWLADLDNFLDENGETLVIFIDAVNEFSGPGGPLALLSDMIATIATEPALRRCKIVMTCRSETWLRYTQQYGEGRPLDPEVFFTPDGEAIRVTGFDEEELRRRTYERYRTFYRLQPARFDDLSGPVRALIAQPFMLSLISDTYANAEGAASQRIPRDLDYYSLFSQLTARKLTEAQILLPAGDIVAREKLPEEIEDFCGQLAEMIYQRLTSDDAALANSTNRDALPTDNVDKTPELQPYIRGGRSLSVLEIVLQIGLLDHIQISRRNATGRLVSSGAFIFFHDQYTQYWLGFAYQRGILGWLDEEALADPDRIAAIAAKVDDIVARAIRAPILSGALDHWFRMNIENFHNRKFAPVMPFLNALAERDSPALHYSLLGLVNNLIIHRYLTAPEVYQAVFKTGSAKLRAILVNSFVAFWPELPPKALTGFLDACDPDRDADTLARLGDIFSLHLRLQPALVSDYLGEAISPLTLISITDPKRLWRQAKFSLQFAIFAAMSNFDRPDILAAVRGFFRSKYRFIVDFVSTRNEGFVLARMARRSLRDFLYARFEAFGVEQWHKFIVSMPESGNDRFFGRDENGVSQHDMLRRFLPYVVALHNGEHESLTLDPSPFRELMLEMLDYKETSIVGYNALLCLPTVLMRADWSQSEAFVMELIGRKTPSVLFYGNLALCNLAYSDPAYAPPGLQLMRSKIVPLLLGENLSCDWSIIFCLATMDVEAMWGDFEAVLLSIVEHCENNTDFAGAKAFDEALYKVCYCHDIALGRRVIDLLLADRPRFLGPRWRKVSMQVFAAMLARSPETLRQIFAAQNVDEAILREARAAQDKEIVDQSRLFPFQVDINRMLAWVYLAEPRLRRVVVRDFIGSLSTGNSVEDFAAGVRRTLVAFIDYFFGKRPEDMAAGFLSQAEIEEEVATARGRRKS